MDLGQVSPSLIRGFFYYIDDDKRIEIVFEY